MKIRMVITLILAAVTGFSLAQRGRDGAATILYWQAPSSLNIYLSGGTKEAHAASMILEPLARYNENGTMVAWLATEIPTVENGGISADLTSITWKLRQDVVWSDGTPFTAEDVVFTGEYCTHEETGCTQTFLFADVTSFEVVDPHTVKINFGVPKPFPYGPFVGQLTPILQKAQFEKCVGANAQNCTEQNFGPIGTGAFVAKEFRANDTVVYEANPNYRDADKPAFQTILLKGGGDAASAARAVLETEEADFAWNLQVEPEILEQMQAAGKGQLVNAYGTSVERLHINLTNPDPALGDKRSEYLGGTNPHPFLSDITVRKALSMAIDRNIIDEVGYGPAGQATCNLLPAPAIYVSTTNDACLTQDMEGAKRLLDEAGIIDSDGDGIREKDGVPLKILYQSSTNSVRQGTQALIKQWWDELGVSTELRNIDAAVFFGNDISSPDTYTKFYADIEMFTNNFDGTDPEAYMGQLTCAQIVSKDNGWGGNNLDRYCNPDYDALVAKMATTSALDERAEIAKQLNDILMQNFVPIPLIHRGSVSAYSDALAGFIMNGWDSELWNVADWNRTH
jgi:peptide/nickel transport system substrate-binding protein